MKIGILTYCNSYNYGAYLQAYNLCSKLNTYKNIEAELIDYSMRQELEIYKVRIHKNPLVTYEKYMKKIAFTKAKRDLCLSQYSVRTDDIETFRNAVYGKYDLIIAGSDQIWQVDGFRGAFNAYWLPGDYGCPKVSFAASGRTPFKNSPEEEFSKIRKAINEFEYVGVRDKATFSNVEGIIENAEKIHMNLDPSFLMQYLGDKAKGKRILKKHGVDIGRPTIAVMTENKDMVQILRRKLGGEFNYIGLFHRQKGAKNVLDVTPFEWVDVIAASDFMVTSYFHGTCYSIINKTPFHTIEMRYRNSESKLLDLLSVFGLENRFSENLKAAINSNDFWNEIRNRNIEWENTDRIIKNNNDEFNDFVSGISEMVRK